ncbi:unnamed protein product [Blepharisma stoltei]|uniref:Acyl carrier protein n=1 Tax=Blepharisma stoltei TaxID=1481888 RepID=A0AAU9K7P1_9CILI|nr:unnamed protein product [Blepharisma stoltei]
MWRLVRAVAGRHFVTAESAGLREKIFEVLKKFDTVDPAKLNQDATFKDIGLDSLDTVEAIVALEDILGVELTDEEALKINSIPQTVDAFEKYTNKK